ncbi:hypothetical protein Geoth_2065 [Parageobacillus thermoglucosidasius C56-YS93]|nr:hypothetical protein Geoth_2065 [Parageobacillus thermoglucosidasius C56-YS93]
MMIQLLSEMFWPNQRIPAFFFCSSKCFGQNFKHHQGRQPIVAIISFSFTKRKTDQNRNKNGRMFLFITC